jgi:hypothetical protein
MTAFGWRGIAVLALGIACAGACTVGERTAPPFDDDERLDAGAELARIDRVAPLRGVPNRGRDPSVIVIAAAIDGQDILEPACVGTLISPRLVLTAASCVTSCGERPSALDPRSLAILVGEEARSARRVARGIEVVAPDGGPSCEASVAILVLDEPVVTIKPLALRARGPAVGDHVRTVRYVEENGGSRRVFREHAPVTDVSDSELAIGEACRRGAPGGPALDEETGEIIGVLLHAGPLCEGPNVHGVYARIDAFSALAEAAFARVESLEEDAKVDAGSSAVVRAAKRGTKQKPASDVGSACVSGGDCAAGVCVTDTGVGAVVRRYCSRECGGGDRCPTRYQCKPVVGGEPSSTACINVR